MVLVVLCIAGFLFSIGSYQQIAATPIQLSSSLQSQARLITVRLTSEAISGSGVLIEHHRDRYSILTCDHVIDNYNNEPYRVLTADGKSYFVEKKTYHKIKGLDLAIIQFNSSENYSIASLKPNNKFQIGSKVLIAGYPNWQYQQESWIDTVTQGIKYFQSSQGHISIFLEKALEEGYRLGISNDVEIGMSGGAVLNSQGSLIGIIGRTKYPIAGGEAYLFVDGTQPDQKLLAQLEDLSWAIPLDRQVTAKIYSHESAQ